MYAATSLALETTLSNICSHYCSQQYLHLYKYKHPESHQCIYIYIYIYTGLDPQTKAWVGHCTCVVETGLATQHWSAKSEGCA